MRVKNLTLHHLDHDLPIRLFHLDHVAFLGAITTWASGAPAHKPARGIGLILGDDPEQLRLSIGRERDD
jgi:hypothetical protein